MSWKSIESSKAYNTLLESCREMCFDGNISTCNYNIIILL